MMTNLWIDDLREPPRDDSKWLWAKTSRNAVVLLSGTSTVFEEISFDHDLGGDDTTRPVLNWMIENLESEKWPSKIVIHTANPVGAKWLRGTAQRYAPEGVKVV